MKIYLIIFMCLSIFSCQQKNADERFSVGMTMDQSDHLEIEMGEAYEMYEDDQSSTSQESTIDRGSKIIKNGNLAFEVTDLAKTKAQIDSTVKRLNGYYENEQYNSSGYHNIYSLSIRIPQVNFDALVSQLEQGTGHLQTKNIHSRDVTEEYVDLNIRLKNNEAYLAQYQVILKKANSIKDILEVKEKIRVIEEEIDSKKGRIKYLDDQVSFSTLNLQLSELVSKQISNKPSFGTRIANAFNDGVKGFISFIVTLIHIWPFILGLIILIVFRKPILNKFRKQKHQ